MKPGSVVSSTAGTDPMPDYREEDVREHRLVDEPTDVSHQAPPAPPVQHPIETGIDHVLSMARGRPAVDTKAATELYATLQNQPATLKPASPTDNEVNADSSRASQLGSGLEAVALILRQMRQDSVAEREARELQAAEHRALLVRHDLLNETVNRHGNQLSGLGRTHTAIVVAAWLVPVVVVLSTVTLILQVWGMAR